MARGKGKGGARTPSNPAPVSGPGALARRTDGGASQPVRPIPAEQHGDRKASMELQQAAPLSGGSGGAPTSSPAPGAGGGGGDPFGDVFAPTQRPAEPMTAGAITDPLAEGDDDMLTLLQVLYEQNPNSDIARLIINMQARG